MPDDIIEEVAEQQDNPADETAAFNADDNDKDELDQDVDVIDETDDEKEPEKSDEKEDGKESEKTDEKESEDEKEEQEDEETDEDVRRGQELLDKKAEQEAKEKEEQEAKEDHTEEPKAVHLNNERFEEKDLAVFHKSVPKNLFPKGEFELEDGTSVNFDEALKDYPELPMMISMVSNNMVRQMVQNGVLMTTEQFKKSSDDFIEKYENNMFARTVTHPEYGVPNAEKIDTSEEYQKWLKDQPKPIQALKESDNPWDHIRLLKRFLGKEFFSKAEKDNKEKDEKRKEAKEKFDKVHKSTVKSKGKPNTSSEDSPDDEDAAFNSDDKDEDEFF